jgi:hypothetical protein
VVGDLPAAVLYSTGTYSNPSWLTALAWAKLTGVPSTFTPSAHTHLAADIPATVLYSSGSYANPAWLTSLAGSKISGAVPTATALAANGANCAAGQAALGVNTSGAAEGCYDPNTYRAQQINFGFGGDPATVIPNTTFNNIWRAHAHSATVTEVACWTDAGTVSLTIRRSDGTNMHSALTCSTTGASTATITTPGVATGQGLGFVTASAATVKNLSVSIKYTRSY